MATEDKKFILEDLLGNSFKGKQGVEADSASIKAAEIVCLYFSSYWSPPCKMFTPILADFYREVNSLQAKQEIVFISSCKTEEDFNKYYEEMPWIALPYSETAKMTQLRNKYDVQQIPTLIVLSTDCKDQNKNEDCKVQSKNGRLDVMNEGEKAFSTWGGTPQEQRQW